MTHEYEGTRRVAYGEQSATFILACPKCGRFVKAREIAKVDKRGQPDGPNADCAKCGPVQMLFEGYL